MDEVEGKDPNRDYVWTNPNDEDCGTEAYVANGYDIETVRPGGPRSRVGRTVKEGSNVTQKGQILVSRDKSFGQAEFAAAQAACDAIDARLAGEGGMETTHRARGVATGVHRDPNVTSFGQYAEIEQ